MAVGERGLSARAIPSGRRATGRLRPPPSKSLSNRYLNLALLAGRPLRIERLLAAEDTDVFLEAAVRLGWKVGRNGDEVDLSPGPPPRSADVWCGASGTMLRFLVATLCTLDGEWRVDGTSRLSQRPLAPLVAGLRRLGASIDCLESEGYAPLVIRGGALAGGAVRLDAGRSSQFASALLMASVRASAPVELTLDDLTSGPYLDLTIEAMADFGARVERAAPRLLRVRPGLAGADRLWVAGDFSSAAYWAAAAALTAGTVEIEGLTSTSLQADRVFLDVLAEMGLDLTWGTDALRAAGGEELVAVDRDLSRCPDQAPTLAALGPFARGVTKIRNVPHLRLKESDRLAAMSAGLRAAGATVTEESDGVVIPGVWAERPPPDEPVTLDPVDDHRLAMSFAILGTRRPGISVSDAGVVAKSYPGFWRDFETVFMP